MKGLVQHFGPQGIAAKRGIGRVHAATGAKWDIEKQSSPNGESRKRDDRQQHQKIVRDSSH